MSRPARSLFALAVTGALVAGCSGDPTPPHDAAPVDENSSLPESLRIATFNIRELSTEALLEVDEEAVGSNAGLQAAAEVVGRIRPDILVVQEIDHDYSAEDDLGLNARRLSDSYLRTALDGDHFPYVFAAPCNTGISSGHDLNNDGEAVGEDGIGSREYGEDCFGFGQYPGQYSMAVLSRFPIDTSRARTFREFLWQDLPGHHLPEDFYNEAAIEDLRLSSKSHWDVPIEIGDRTLHLWVSHPTPPVFDGDENRNGRRNYDEIAFWVAYLDDQPVLYDDRGQPGGYTEESSFVIAGDLNSDPRSDGAFFDGRQSIDLLLSDSRLQDLSQLFVSDGAAANDADDPLAARATAVFAGGMRVDYLLPSAGIDVTAGGVFWPSEESDPGAFRAAATASDHRLVWIDLDPESLR